MRLPHAPHGWGHLRVNTYFMEAMKVAPFWSDLLVGPDEKTQEADWYPFSRLSQPGFAHPDCFPLAAVDLLNHSG